MGSNDNKQSELKYIIKLENGIQLLMPSRPTSRDLMVSIGMLVQMMFFADSQVNPDILDDIDKYKKMIGEYIDKIADGMKEKAC